MFWTYFGHSHILKWCFLGLNNFWQFASCLPLFLQLPVFCGCCQIYFCCREWLECEALYVTMSLCHLCHYLTMSPCYRCRALWRLFFVCPTAICTHAWRCTYVSVQHVAVKKSHFCDCWYLLLTWSLLFSNLLSTMLQVETMRLLILGKFGRCSVPISSARNERWFWQRLKILRLILGKVGRCSLPSCCARSITPVQRKPPR